MVLDLAILCSYHAKSLLFYGIENSHIRGTAQYILQFTCPTVMKVEAHTKMYWLQFPPDLPILRHLHTWVPLFLVENIWGYFRFGCKLLLHVQTTYILQLHGGIFLWNKSLERELSQYYTAFRLSPIFLFPEIRRDFTWEIGLHSCTERSSNFWEIK